MMMIAGLAYLLSCSRLYCSLATRLAYGVSRVSCLLHLNPAITGPEMFKSTSPASEKIPPVVPAFIKQQAEQHMTRIKTSMKHKETLLSLLIMTRFEARSGFGASLGARINNDVASSGW
ncbi:hypothetical protein BX666DRAFT_1467429 [Dichotomocladium elegans]|nr:hypothetical protein BX666DRAFT_1467429 [Dichotomocladium elegans]